MDKSMSFGTHFKTSHTTVLRLVCTAAEYCALVRMNNAHARNEDNQLNIATKPISDCINTIPVHWLRTLCPPFL